MVYSRVEKGCMRGLAVTACVTVTRFYKRKSFGIRNVQKTVNAISQWLLTFAVARKVAHSLVGCDAAVVQWNR